MVVWLRRIGGALALLFGAAIAAWIIYDMIEPQPETEGQSPLPALITVVMFFYVGNKWIRGEPDG